MTGSTRPVARTVSVIGHPAAMMTAAAAVAAPEGHRVKALALVLLMAGAVVVYGIIQTRRGHWTHPDASQPAERTQLLGRVGPLLLLAACLVWLVGGERPAALALALSAGIVLVAGLSARVGKLSLHVAFAVFAAILAWPMVAASGALAALALAVAWSRLALRRHVPVDVALGALAGVAAGLAFQSAVPMLA